MLTAALRAAEIAYRVTKKLPFHGQVLDIVLGPEDADFQNYVSPTVAPPQQAASLDSEEKDEE